MTFNLTGECVFCAKKRDWNTLLRIFYSKTQHDWEIEGGKPYESGWSVTVCHECRKTHTIEDLIKAAKEVF